MSTGSCHGRCFAGGQVVGSSDCRIGGRIRTCHIASSIQKAQLTHLKTPAGAQGKAHTDEISREVPREREHLSFIWNWLQLRSWCIVTETSLTRHTAVRTTPRPRKQAARPKGLARLMIGLYSHLPASSSLNIILPNLPGWEPGHQAASDRTSILNGAPSQPRGSHPRSGIAGLFGVMRCGREALQKGGCHWALINPANTSPDSFPPCDHPSKSQEVPEGSCRATH